MQEDALVIMEVMRSGDESEPLSPEVAKALKALWKDGGVQEAYSRRSHFQLNDSAKYFLDQVPSSSPAPLPGDGRKEGRVDRWRR